MGWRDTSIPARCTRGNGSWAGRGKRPRPVALSREGSGSNRPESGTARMDRPRLLDGLLRREEGMTGVRLSRPWKGRRADLGGGPISVLNVVTRDAGIILGWVRREGSAPWTAHTPANR